MSTVYETMAEYLPDEMMRIFEDLGFLERMRRMYYGLSQDKESGEYKFAKLQLQRLSAPAAAILLPILVVVFMIVFGGQSQIQDRTIVTEIITPETVEILDEPPPPPEPDQVVDPTQVDFTTDVPLPVITEAINEPMSPQPAEFDSVLTVKSPITMRGIYGQTRNAGARGRALAQYKGSGATEAAVLRALRWLKKNQEPDGSWSTKSGGGSVAIKNTESRDGAPVGMTGLGILSFLAHGETPGDSEEFGSTVQQAITYLLESQTSGGSFSKKDGRKDYSHLIATYALAEAAGMTQHPQVRAAAERAMTELIRRQKAEGGWDYIGEAAPGRIDVSMTAWASQAIKAGMMADLECDGLVAARARTLEGLKLFFRQTKDGGRFTYRNTENRWFGLTGAATLSLQLLGSGNRADARAGVAWLRNNVSFDWENPTSNLNENPIYNWYYITQVMFHEGGQTWDNWNRQFALPLVKQQKIVPKAIEDAKGNLVDIGYWEPVTEKEWVQGPSYNTMLCALQLMVYYRYLPTFKTPTVEAEVITADNEDVPVNIQL